MDGADAVASLVGERVLLSGIVAKPALNFRTGIVESHVAAKDRLAVKLDPVGGSSNQQEEPILLKPSNVQDMTSARNCVLIRLDALNGRVKAHQPAVPLKQHYDDMLEVEALLKLLPTLGDVRMPPSTVRVQASRLLVRARLNVAEALEDAEQYGEAQPFYNRLVDEARSAAAEGFEDRIELAKSLNSTGLCYQRRSMLVEALTAYNEGLAVCVAPETGIQGRIRDDRTRRKEYRDIEEALKHNAQLVRDDLALADALGTRVPEVASLSSAPAMTSSTHDAHELAHVGLDVV